MQKFRLETRRVRSNFEKFGVRVKMLSKTEIRFSGNWRHPTQDIIDVFYVFALGGKSAGLRMPCVFSWKASSQMKSLYSLRKTVAHYRIP